MNGTGQTIHIHYDDAVVLLVLPDLHYRLLISLTNIQINHNPPVRKTIATSPMNFQNPYGRLYCT